jgi:hypothetical protein
MENEKVSSEEEKIVPPEEKEETSEEGKEFEKESEFVPSNKYNQAIRKQRELELSQRELQRQLEEAKSGKVGKEESDEEDDEELFGDEEPEAKKISSLLDEKIKPVLERLNQKEADERKRERSTFFKKYPQYLNNSEKWQSLLNELDEFNPKSKASYYSQLVKAHRIISGDTISHAEIESKKREMASELASKGDGSQKPSQKKSSEDERADRLAQKMPIGFKYSG